eukprot:14653630-Ditylum_brightwellii.AAC.1
MEKRCLPNTVVQHPTNSIPQSARPQSDTSTASEESDDEIKLPFQHKKHHKNKVYTTTEE